MADEIRRGEGPHQSEVECDPVRLSYDKLWSPDVCMGTVRSKANSLHMERSVDPG